MIPPVDLPAGTTLPPEIRTADASVQDEYRSALAFERVLLGQLAKAMQATVSQDGEGSAATQTYKDMLPDTMADALVAGGGIGLASDLVRSLRTERP
ncbi:MAG: rod-binding protein [Solirubrobacteraceae bacterium]